MENLLSRVAPHRRVLSIGLTLAVVALVGYGLLVSLAPRAMARQPQPSQPGGSAVAMTPVPSAATPSASPAVPAPASLTPLTASPAETPAEVAWSEQVKGRVVDARKQPIAGASVVNAGKEVRTEADGTFVLTKPTGAIIVKHPGYEKVTLTTRKDSMAPSADVVLKPFAVKAAYLTYYGVMDRGIRSRVLDLVAKTELNAVVIDVKGDRGWLLYRSELPQVAAVGAQGPAVYKEFDALMAELKARNVYTIARIVTFKDNMLAGARPDLAIMDTRTGKPWIDNEKLAWVDPFREEAWNYNIAIAKEAVRKGFDEVQFDYVRFPTDGRLSAAKYMKENNRDTRLPTIAAFLGKARREIGATGAFVGADVFGYTAFNENDTDIGQRVEELTPNLDYICPMVYPSGYHKGIPGVPNPVANPYQVVHESVRLTKKRATHTVVRVRPWLQDFRDYAYDRRIFGAHEVKQQIKGSDDAGGTGWMLWNPKNDYTGAALQAKGTLAAK
jgi:hypothetical protein